MRSIVIIAFVFLFSACKQETLKESSDTPSSKIENIMRDIVNLSPQKPVSGKFRAVIELGASGFNYFVIQLDSLKNWELKTQEYENSRIIGGMTNPELIKAKIKDYTKKIEDFGVKSEDIHIVVSSGAMKEKITLNIVNQLKAQGDKINTMTPEEEAKYSLMSVLPSEFRKKAFVVDIGSGNTKISYLDKNLKIQSKETYGALYCEKELNHNQVYTDTRKSVAQIPVEQRKVCFILGGIPYKLAKYTKKDSSGRYTFLNSDVKKYQDIIDIEGKQIKCGLNLYKAIIDETKCHHIVFDWESNFTVGYLLNLPY